MYTCGRIIIFYGRRTVVCVKPLPVPVIQLPNQLDLNLFLPRLAAAVSWKPGVARNCRLPCFWFPYQYWWSVISNLPVPLITDGSAGLTAASLLFLWRWNEEVMVSLLRLVEPAVGIRDPVMLNDRLNVMPLLLLISRLFMRLRFLMYPGMTVKQHCL